MEIVKTVSEMQHTSDVLRTGGKRIGLVPTMGYLHEGHASLIRRARKLSDAVVTSIFVNPTQFGPGEDFERYPRDFERDKALAATSGTDVLFCPEQNEMYPGGPRTLIEPGAASRILEGNVRPGHFRGVATVVAKLVHITKPHVAVFGQKDAQQAFIIRQMIEDLNLDVRIVIAPIVRESDGLALSSRNVYLNAAERKNALVLSRSLFHAEERVKAGETSVKRLKEEITRILMEGNPTNVDYVAFVRLETFEEVDALEPPHVLIALAVRFGTTRLIDNAIVSIN